MGRAELNQTWSDLDQDDLLALFDELAPTLDRAVAKLAQPLEKAIQLRAAGTYIQDTSDPRESAERLGKPPTSIIVMYGRRTEIVGLGTHVLDGEGGIKHVTLHLSLQQWRGGPTEAVLSVNGEDDHATHGFFRDAVNSLEASIGRLKDVRAQALALQGKPDMPGLRGRIQRWLRHPFGSGVASGLTVTVIVALAGLVWAVIHH